MPHKKYCGSGKTPPGKEKGSMLDCVKAGKVSLYGVNKVDPRLLSKKDELKKKQASKSEIVREKIKLEVKIKKIIEKAKKEKDVKKRQEMKTEGKKMVEELKKLENKLDVIQANERKEKKPKKLKKVETVKDFGQFDN